MVLGTEDRQLNKTGFVSSGNSKSSEGTYYKKISGTQCHKGYSRDVDKGLWEQ